MNEITLSGPSVAPPDGPAKRLVVLLHGYGSDGADLIGLVPYFRDLMPQAAFLAPNAPYPCAINPSGYEWFPLDLDRDFSRLHGVETVRPVLGRFLEQLWAQTGLGAADTVLVGFSQGAMIALDTGFRLKEPLAAIVGFSGGIVAPERLVEEVKSSPPVCLLHGDSDDVVPPMFSIGGAQALEALGFDVTLHVSTGTGHTIAPDSLEVARRFLVAHKLADAPANA